MAAGILLTGGASRRLGTDKARLHVGGVPLAVTAAATLAAVTHPTVEVGDGVSRLDAVREAPPGGGPLAAVVAGYEHLDALGYWGDVVVIATDMPRLTPALLQLIATWPAPADCAVVPVVDGVRQPLCARYPEVARYHAAALLAQQQRSMHSLLDVLTVVELHESEWGDAGDAESFLDIDTPADLDRLRQRRQ